MKYGLVTVRTHPRALVYLNGVKVPDCFAAHDDEGWADRFVRGEHGILLKADRSGAQSERLHGEVVVVQSPPRVSIITTVYDRTDCLRRCLRSVQHLVYKDVEQIVVADFPPEETWQEIEQLCAEFGVRLYTLPRRHNDWGISPANAGLRAAAGEFVCFLSDDNAFLPDHFGPLVAALDADPGLGFAYSSCLYAGHKELRQAPPAGAGIDLGQPLFRRSVLKEQFDDVLPCRGAFSWDWMLISALMANGVRWQHVDEATFVFRLMAYPALMEALA